jgi:trans-2,3-dihydro-3-hydroxyanthranilate isomerase
MGEQMEGPERREWRMVSFPVPGRTGAGGNPAGVVLDPPELGPEEMTRIAVRLNPLSETAFVGTPADGVYPLRYFAPGGEVDLCGHATAAAFAVLALSDRLGPLPAQVASTAPGGSVRGRIEPDGDGVVVWMDMPLAQRVPVSLDMEAVASALGLPVEVLTARPSAAVEDVGIRVAVLPLADLAALDAMRPDFSRLRELGAEDRIILYYPFVFDAGTGRVRARAFAPAVDIDEDPATGTAAASLGAYLVRERLAGEDVQLRIRQGEAMGRPSELRLAIRHQDGRPESIRVGGQVRGAPVRG